MENNTNAIKKEVQDQFLTLFPLMEKSIQNEVSKRTEMFEHNVKREMQNVLGKLTEEIRKLRKTTTLDTRRFKAYNFSEEIDLKLVINEIIKVNSKYLTELNFFNCNFNYVCKIILVKNNSSNCFINNVNQLKQMFISELINLLGVKHGVLLTCEECTFNFLCKKTDDYYLNMFFNNKKMIVTAPSTGVYKQYGKFQTMSLTDVNAPITKVSKRGHRENYKAYVIKATFLDNKLNP